jgi:hypothetical protein
VSLANDPLNCGACNSVVALKRADRDRNVVEDAEAFAVIGEGMMRSAGEIHRDPVLDRVPCGLARSARRPVRTFDDRFGPRKSETPFFIGREPSGCESIDVVGGVDQ